METPEHEQGAAIAFQLIEAGVIEDLRRYAVGVDWEPIPDDWTTRRALSTPSGTPYALLHAACPRWRLVEQTNSVRDLPRRPLFPLTTRFPPQTPQRTSPENR